jgi:flagellum-specific peptidoglycan hydrolase FlgJ
MRDLIILLAFGFTTYIGINKQPVPEVVTVDVVEEVKVQAFTGDDDVKRYVLRFQKLAIDEMGKYKIPASVKIAQGILESKYGTSYLSVKGNNHFGIKCKGKCNHKTCINLCDDSCKDYFVSYDSAWASYRAHSLLLSDTNKRYHTLIDECTDYSCWAYGLKRKGYATSKTYATKLIKIIEKYNLHVLDNGIMFV